MPSNSAAPRGPEILPFAFSRAAMMLFLQHLEKLGLKANGYLGDFV
jgi:hypothetical protein